MRQMASVTNMQTVTSDAARTQAPSLSSGTKACCSRSGENNSMHVVGLVLAVAAIAIVAGYVNVKVSAGK